MSSPLRHGAYVFAWAWQNLRHHRIRTALTALGVALSVAITVSVLGFYAGYRDSLEREIEGLGFQVLVTAKGCPIEAATLLLKGGNIPMYLDEAVFDDVASDPAVARVTRLLMQVMPDPEHAGHHAAATPASATSGTVLLGVDDAFRDLKPWLALQRGQWLDDPDADEAVLGWSLAEYRRLDVGDTLPAPGGRSLRVVGVLDRSGGQEDGTVFVPVRVAQQIFGRKDMLTGIGVQVRDPEGVDAFVDRIYDRPGIQVVTLGHVRGVILDLLATARKLTLGVVGVALLVSLVGVANCVMISVIERLPQLGTMRALGGPRRDLFLLIMTETTLICCAGAVAGVGGALGLRAASEVLLRRILPFAPSGPLALFDPVVVGVSILVILAAGIAAGLYPAFRATRVEPLQSMRGPA